LGLKENMKTYLFYDVETSGLNPAFDQILTFAGIRTDFSFKEISRELITIKLRQDIIPSPHAFITHCLTQDELESGITEYQAAQRIHKLFNTPGTISLGYNSLGFDDEFLRFLFYRNLLDPYAHQYAKHCSRMDLLPVTTLFKVFCDHVLEWPILTDGRPSLKLELLSQKNGFMTSGRAHEAMNDVEAVIELARIFSRQKDVWEYALAFFNKTKDGLRINSIEKECRVGDSSFRICLMVSSSFGPKNNYIAPVIHVGESVPYKNQSLWIRLDREEGFELEGGGETDETQIFDLFVIRKRPGDQLIVLPWLDRFKPKMTPRSQAAFARNIEKLQSHPDSFLKTIHHHQEYRYPLIPEIDLDAALYQSGFFSSSEKKEINRFHSSEDKNKAAACETFANGRVKEMATRILLRNFEDHSSIVGNKEYTDHLRRLLSQSSEDHIVGYRNDVKYDVVQGMRDLREVQEREKELTPLQKEILIWLKCYLEQLVSSDTEFF
jgi:exodeoxyribonuclease-1